MLDVGRLVDRFRIVKVKVAKIRVRLARETKEKDPRFGIVKRCWVFWDIQYLTVHMYVNTHLHYCSLFKQSRNYNAMH